MSQGLQVFDNAGRILVDVQDRLPKIFATYSITPNPYTFSGFVAVAGMARDGRWYVVGSTTQAFTHFYCSTQSGGFNWQVATYGLAPPVIFTVFRL